MNPEALRQQPDPFPEVGKGTQCACCGGWFNFPAEKAYGRTFCSVGCLLSDHPWFFDRD